MNASGIPDDVARALVALGLEATGRRGTRGWLAREQGGGLAELVVLGPADDEAAAARLAALRHDHLVPVRSVVALTGGRSALLVEHAPGPSLATALRARVPLTDGEAVTVVVPLARALDALHGAGLAYGPPTADDVLFCPDGRPVLAARPPRLASSDRPPDDDLRGLLSMVLGAMAPPLVLPALPDDEWADDEPTLRPVLEALLASGCRSSEEVARACFDAVQPEPVRLPDAGTLARADVLGPNRGASRGPTDGLPIGGGRLPRPAGGGRQGRLDHRRGAVRSAPLPVTRGSRRAQRRRSRRRARLGAGVLAVLALVVAAVVLVRPADAVRADGVPPAPGSSSATADPVRTPAAPADAAAALTRRRAAVLAAGDPSGLDGVDLAGGPARAADEALLASLGADRLDGLGVDVRGAEVVGGPAEDGAVRVAVTAATGPYTRVAADGGRTAVPGTTPRTVVLALCWTADGWRVRDVSAPTAAP
jgi:hypothetical protein